MQDLDKYRVPPPDSQPEDVHDPAWFESPLKHYVPSWLLSQRYQETAAGGSWWETTETNRANSDQTWETPETHGKIDKAWGNTAEDSGEKSDWASYQTWETAETYGKTDKAWGNTAEDSGDKSDWASTGEIYNQTWETAETKIDKAWGNTADSGDKSDWDRTGESYDDQTWETEETYGKIDKSWDNNAEDPGKKPALTGTQTWETAETYAEKWDNKTAEDFGEQSDWARNGDNYDQTWETAETYGEKNDDAWANSTAELFGEKSDLTDTQTWETAEAYGTIDKAWDNTAEQSGEKADLTNAPTSETAETYGTIDKAWDNTAEQSGEKADLTNAQTSETAETYGTIDKAWDNTAEQSGEKADLTNAQTLETAETYGTIDKAWDNTAEQSGEKSDWARTGESYDDQTWETEETYGKIDKAWDNTAEDSGDKSDWTHTGNDYDQTAETYGENMDDAWANNTAELFGEKSDLTDAQTWETEETYGKIDKAWDNTADSGDKSDWARTGESYDDQTWETEETYGKIDKAWGNTADSGDKSDWDRTGESYDDQTWETEETYAEKWDNKTAEDSGEKLDLPEGVTEETAEEIYAKIDKSYVLSSEHPESKAKAHKSTGKAKKRIRGKTKDTANQKNDGSEAIHWVPITKAGYVVFATGQGNQDIYVQPVSQKEGPTPKTDSLVTWTPVTREGVHQFMRNCGQVNGIESATLEELIKLLKQSSAKDVLEKHGDAPPYVSEALYQIQELWTTWREDTVEGVSYWLMEMLLAQVLDSQCFPVKKNITTNCPVLSVSLAQEAVEPRYPFGRPGLAERRRSQGAQKTAYYLSRLTGV